MKNKYYLLIIIVLAFFTLGATNSGSDRFKNPSTESMKEEKQYEISTCVFQMGNAIWVFETKMNAKTGKVVSRKQVHSKKYKNIK